MRTIHKFPLYVRDGWQEIKLPVGAGTIHVAEQPPGSSEQLYDDGTGQLRPRLMLWVEVHTGRDVETRRFAVVPTGGEVTRSPSGKRPYHVGTVVSRSGDLVWHVYGEPDLA